MRVVKTWAREYVQEWRPSRECQSAGRTLRRRLIVFLSRAAEERMEDIIGILDLPPPGPGMGGVGVAAGRPETGSALRRGMRLIREGGRWTSKET